MKLRALFLIISGAALLFACAQPQSPSGARLLSGPSCVADPQNPGGPPLLNVLVLQNGYNPSIYYQPSPQTYRAPQKDPRISINANSALADDLQKAFAAAPPFFKQRLCNLDGVYINPTGCSSFDGSMCLGFSGGDKGIVEASWGFREGPSIYPVGTPLPLGHRGEYIAISAAPWSGPNVHAPVFSKYERRLLRLLLPPWPSTAGPAPNYADYGAANPGAETSAMAVLGALAHEYGHVLWYDTFRPNGTDDFSFCGGTFFGNSWAGALVKPPLWRGFNDQTYRQTHLPGDVQIGWIKQVIRRGDNIGVNLASRYLHWYYNSSKTWAGYFATRSPDEDFIETFKFYVLQRANPPLTSLPIRLRASQYNFDDDVPAQHPLRSPPVGVYETKRACFLPVFP
jgi:hypothetical protein